MWSDDLFVYSALVPVDFFNQRESAPRLRPAAVESKLSNNLHCFFLGDPMLFAQFQVGFQLRVQACGKQRRNSNHAPVSSRQFVFSCPNFPE